MLRFFDGIKKRSVYPINTNSSVCRVKKAVEILPDTENVMLAQMENVKPYIANATTKKNKKVD